MNSTSTEPTCELADMNSTSTEPSCELLLVLLRTH